MEPVSATKRACEIIGFSLHSPFAESQACCVNAQSYMPNGRKWKDDVPKDLSQWPWTPHGFSLSQFQMIQNPPFRGMDLILKDNLSCSYT